MSIIALHTPDQAARWLRARVTGALQADSRRVGAGDGFVAWPGAATDGRAHVASALAQGAAACLVEQQGAEAFAFDNASIAGYAGLKAATGPIAAAYYEHPSRQLELLAVTGTNGKTSTAWWLAEALSKLDPHARHSRVLAAPHGGVHALGRPGGAQARSAPAPCGVVGTLGIGVPPDLSYTGLTTPDPVMLQRELRGFVDRGFRACAIEASSIGIAERRLDGAQIAIAVFTNFTQDHLDYHGSMDAYWQAKVELFRWPGLRAAVVNIDDVHGASLVGNLLDAGTGALDVWTTSAAGAPARLAARDIGYDGHGLQFTVVEQGAAPERLATGLIGQYNVANLLGVMGALRALGLSLAEAVAACRNLSSVPGRMERVSVDGPPLDAKAPSGGSEAREAASVGAAVSVDGPPLDAKAPSGGSEAREAASVGAAVSMAGSPLAVIDYAHTPDALDKALAGLRPLAVQRGGLLWCLFGCGGERDPIKRPMMAAVAETQADRVVVTSDNPRGEKPESIISQILLGFACPEAVQVEPDRARAIAQTLAQAAPADVVLVAGKGHEAWQQIAGERIAFSDRSHALDALVRRSRA